MVIEKAERIEWQGRTTALCTKIFSYGSTDTLGIYQKHLAYAYPLLHLELSNTIQLAKQPHVT